MHLLLLIYGNSFILFAWFSVLMFDVDYDRGQFGFFGKDSMQKKLLNGYGDPHLLDWFRFKFIHVL
jgi:hypothetical protein